MLAVQSGEINKCTTTVSCCGQYRYRGREAGTDGDSCHKTKQTEMDNVPQGTDKEVDKNIDKGNEGKFGYISRKNRQNLGKL